jgi:two-component system, cell cycle sensor histidine kinase and response regulator CckA
MQTLRVLIVEDSEDDAALVVRELIRGGFDVSHLRVDSASALLDALESKWDIVISDHSMPGFSGTDALRLLRGRDSETPFLYVSGTLGEETAVEALKSGAQDYLVKGKLTRLVPAIERELRDYQTKRERERLEAQVHLLRRFEAIGRLAGGIAHDFNNALAAITGWAEIGQQELPENHKTRERFHKIRLQAEKASGLTRQLLAFARRQVLQPHNVDLNLLVRDTVGLLAKIIGDRIQIEVDLASDLNPAWADATQIEQVVMNLCINSRDAMPEGGRIIIQTRMKEMGTGEVLPRSGKYVQLVVSDEGMGMDPRTLECIFEPFFTTKEIGKGTGLGLATVYGIVKQHDGIIDVESAVGVGTTFRIYLPVGTGAVETLSRRSEPIDVHGTETVLVADDHDGVREAAKAMLEAFGYRVLSASSGAEAIDIFAANLNSIDLVILDVVMPIMTGPQVLAKMLASKPSLKAILTTGYTSEADSLKSAANDSIVLLQKPYGSNELGRQIRSVLDGRC